MLNIPREYGLAFLSLSQVIRGGNSRNTFTTRGRSQAKAANDDNSWIIIPLEPPGGKIRDGERDTAIAGLAAMFAAKRKEVGG